MAIHLGYEDIKKEYADRNAWGLSSMIDLIGCKPELIRSAAVIKEYVKQLCQLIQMKRFQDTIVVNFGEDEKVAGYSMIQLIETSSLIAHFSNKTNNAYIDIFSCKLYDPNDAASFSQQFFGSYSYKMHINFR